MGLVKANEEFFNGLPIKKQCLLEKAVDMF